VALHRPPSATRQGLEAPVETPRQLRRAHRADLRRRQLDRQRHPVESPTHLQHRSGVLARQRKVSIGALGPLHEQLHRLGLRDRLLAMPGTTACALVGETMRARNLRPSRAHRFGKQDHRCP